MISDIEKLKGIEDKKVVLLQSGGLDSCVCASILSSLGFDIHHLFVDYGQNTRVQEEKSVNQIISRYGGTLHKVSLNADWLSETALAKGDVADWDEQGSFNTVTSGIYVPLRNHVLLSLAGSLADSLGIKYICSALDGAETLDGVPQSGTTDKHPTFVKKVEESMTEASSLYHIYGERFTILTPVMGLFKEDIIKMGLEFQTDFSLSWSCYNSFETPCGKCSACRERAKGFYYAGIKDPLLQEYNINIPLNKLFETT